MSIESSDITLHNFPCKVQGKDTILKLKTDLTWGETQELLDRSVRMLDNGTKDFQFSIFCDILLTKVIVEGLPFPPTNIVKMKTLSLTETSTILGEILRIIPLENCLAKIGLGATKPEATQ